MVTESPKNSVTKDDNLYERDYYLWLENTAQILREQNLARLDIPNLLEEIEDMGKSEKRAVFNNLKILLMHLLKYKYQQQKRSNSWRYTITEHRQRIEAAFEDSPSLNKYFLESFDKCYQNARKLAADETGLSIDIFPVQSPFASEETLNSDYLPD
ncbi:MAG: DUF29 domain-containing protein [Xenococcaceae cyanobacterium]